MNFWSLMYLLRNVETSEGIMLRKRTRVYNFLMNALYIFVMLAAIFWLPPVCQNGKVYPHVFNWSAMCFIFNAVYHWIIHSMDYGLYWEKSDNVKPEIHDKDDKCLDEATISKLHGPFKLREIKEVFEKQMKWYVWFQFAVVLYNIGMQIIGRKNMDGNGDGLACYGPGGQKWLYKSWWGEAFVTLHIF
jgi:hypothetical protein